MPVAARSHGNVAPRRTTTSLMTSLLAVVAVARSTIDLAHNGRRFRSRFCSTAGDQALLHAARAPGFNPGVRPSRARPCRRPENTETSFTSILAIVRCVHWLSFCTWKHAVPLQRPTLNLARCNNSRLVAEQGMGRWVMGHGSNGSRKSDGSHGSWVTRC